MNKGCFHEVYNYFGIYADINGDIGVRSPLLNSTADCFSPANIGTDIGHPQGIDKSKYVTADQWIDLRIEASAISESDELNRVGTKAKSGSLDGIGGVVACVFSKNVVVTFRANNVVSGRPYTNYTLELPYGTFNENAEWYEFGDGGRSYNTNYKVYITGNNGKGYEVTDVSGNKTDRNFIYVIDETNDYSTNFTDGNTYSLSIVKTLPHPSSGTALRTDVIGSIENYPQEWKDRLASGLPLIGMNPLLVNQDGTSSLPDTDAVHIHSSKVINALSYVYTTNKGDIYNHWLGYLDSVDMINNSLTVTNASSNVLLLSYTAKIPTTQVSEPKAVKLVGNYVTATNSHSIYKGNQLVPTGKVNVGNGDNGLESRVVENAVVGAIPIIMGETYIGTLESDTLYEFINFTDMPTRYYKTIDGYTLVVNGTFDNNLNITSSPNWRQWTNIQTTPSHNTISLDNSNSPAVKFIETIAEDDDGMAHYQVFAQEMEYNETDGDYADDIPTFPNLTNGTADNLLGTDRVKTVVASIPLNKYIGV